MCVSVGDGIFAPAIGRRSRLLLRLAEILNFLELVLNRGKVDGKFEIYLINDKSDNIITSPPVY